MQFSKESGNRVEELKWKVIYVSLQDQLSSIQLGAEKTSLLESEDEVLVQRGDERHDGLRGPRTRKRGWMAALKTVWQSF